MGRERFGSISVLRSVVVVLCVAAYPQGEAVEAQFVTAVQGTVWEDGEMGMGLRADVPMEELFGVRQGRWRDLTLMASGNYGLTTDDETRVSLDVGARMRILDLAPFALYAGAGATHFRERWTWAAFGGLGRRDPLIFRNSIHLTGGDVVSGLRLERDWVSAFGEVRYTRFSLEDPGFFTSSLGVGIALQRARGPSSTEASEEEGR